jgi:iron complex outermembrane receptor protein
MPKQRVACISACTIAVCGAMGFAPQVFGEAQPAAEPGGLEEIVVTAQRREERLQDVPISVTALTGSQLQQQQVFDVTRLTNAAPSVWVAQALDPTDIVIGIRGLSETIPQMVVDPAVGIYVDGVYVSRSAGANVSLIDMERVEVLRGPQGTLFGRNTIGGAFNITTNRPTDKLEGSLEATGGNYDTRAFTGVLNVPLVGDTLDARFVYQHSEHGGYEHSDYLGQDLNSLKEDYFRGTFKLQASEHWQALLAADYANFRGHSAFSKFAYFDPTAALPGAPPFNVLIPALNGHPGDLLSNYVGGNFHANAAGINPDFFTKTYSTTGTVTGQFDNVAVKSISSYRHASRDSPVDLDGTPYPFLQIPYEPFSYHQISQELQAYGKALDSRLDWIGGLYYFRETGNQQVYTQFLAPLAPINIGDYDALNVSKAIFAQLTYEIVSRLRLTLGARYTRDTRNVDYHDHTSAGLCTVPAQILNEAGVCSATGEVVYSYTPFTAGLDYRLSDSTLLYAKLSRGYRSGGWPQSVTNPAGFVPFGPENVLSPEVGAKIELFDQRLRLNSAAFYSNYKQIQVSQDVPSAFGPATITTNAGDGRIYGGEMEATALIQKLRVNLSVGLVQPKYTQGPLVGTPFLNVSKMTTALALSYPIDTPVGQFDLNSDYAWRSALSFFPPIPNNAAASEALTQNGYGLLGARIVYHVAQSPFEVSLWGKNLTGKQYKVRTIDFVSPGLGNVIYLPGDPLTFGASVDYKF